MRKLTIVSNSIFRGALIVAMGAAVMQIAYRGSLLSIMANGADTAESFMNGLRGVGPVLTIALILAALASIAGMSNKEGNHPVARTIVLAALAGISTIGTIFFAAPGMIVSNLIVVAIALLIAVVVGKVVQ